MSQADVQRAFAFTLPFSSLQINRTSSFQRPIRFSLSQCFFPAPTCCTIGVFPPIPSAPTAGGNPSLRQTCSPGTRHQFPWVRWDRYAALFPRARPPQDDAASPVCPLPNPTAPLSAPHTRRSTLPGRLTGAKSQTLLLRPDPPGLQMPPVRSWAQFHALRHDILLFVSLPDSVRPFVLIVFFASLGQFSPSFVVKHADYLDSGGSPLSRHLRQRSSSR